MKKLFFAIFSIMLVSTNVNGQDAGKPKKQVFAWVKSTMDEIGISKEVQTKIEEFKKQNDADQKALKESDAFKALSEVEQKKQMGALLGKRQKTIYEMLTTEQQAKVDAMREKIKKENEANGY
jgi:5'-deoxynucleotidase YfbR-like HD superfamily hydrolase